MNKKQILTISFLATTFVGVAGEVDQVVNDTVRLNEVVVTGTMTEVNRKFLPMTVTSLDKQELRTLYQLCFDCTLRTGSRNVCYRTWCDRVWGC